MDDMGPDDPVSQYVHLGSIFFAIAIVVWTSVAVWLCYSGPPGSEPGADGDMLDGKGELSDSVVGQVANSFAEMLLEGKEKGGRGALDLSKLEELLAPGRLDCKVGVIGKKLGSALLSKVAGAKDGSSPHTGGLVLGGDKESLAAGGIDPRATPSPARAHGDYEGGDRQAPDLTAFREQLREKLAASFNVSLSRKGEDSAALGEGAEKSGGSSDRKSAGAKREALEDFLKQLLHPPGAGGFRGAGVGNSGEDKLGAAASALRSARGKVSEDCDEKDGCRPTTMLSMAEHAREIGNKYLQDRHFAAAAHCYEVACLLCHAGSNATSQLAAYHCNCALACLELGRYGDAINESNAALVLTPPNHLAVKALYRLAVAHANLKNIFEARRCLKRCLQLDPLNEYVRVFLSRVGEEDDEEEVCTPGEPDGRLVWIDPPKKVQCLGAVARDKARGKKGKIKNGTSETSEVRLDREAGLWHTVSRHNNKLYILGGWADSPSVQPSSGDLASGKGGLGLSSVLGGGVQSPEAARGSDELHILDPDTFELRRLSGPNSKPPHPCCCHSATMVGTNMVVFGGLGPPVDQPPLVMVFDVVQGKWRVPTTSGIPPRQRQGHTANAVQNDRYLCVFGGIEPTGEQRVARVYNDAHLLDLESFSWRKLEVSGRRPPARFGHSATNLPGSLSRLLVIGGRDTLSDPAAGGLTGLHILDTERRTWTQQTYSGSPPQRAFYHTATVLDDCTLLVCASGSRLDSQDMVPLHLLDLDAWRWSTPRASGAGPAPRIGHTATSVGSRVYIFGGAVRRGGQASIDKSVHVLELSTPQPRVEEVNVSAVAKAAPLPLVSGKLEKKKEEKVIKADAKAAASTTSSVATSPVVAADEQQQAEGTADGVSGIDKASTSAETSSDSTAATNGKSVDERIEMMLKESGFVEEAFDDDDVQELSFEELLAQEKVFFQSGKLSFPRPT